MFARLLALFVIVPAIELYLLIQLGTLIGALETFGIILITGLIGSYMAKSQGLSVWKRLQTRLSTGAVPGQELMDAVIILISGALLITPGVLTDIVGLLGLFPVTRKMIRTYVKERFATSISTGGIRFQAFSTPYPNNGFQTSQERPESPHTSQESDVQIGGKAKRRPSRHEKLD